MRKYHGNVRDIKEIDNGRVRSEIKTRARLFAH